MKKVKMKSKKVMPTRGITHIKGETKLGKLNKEALERIRAFKGMFG